MLNGEDLRRRRYVERKAALRKLSGHHRGIQYVEHAEGHGDKMFAAVCHVGLEGIVSKKLDAPYRSGPSKTSDQSQESEGCNSRYRRHILKKFARPAISEEPHLIAFQDHRGGPF